MNQQKAMLDQRLKEADIPSRCYLNVGKGYLELVSHTNKLTGEKTETMEYLDKAAYETDFPNRLYSFQEIADKTRYGLFGVGRLIPVDYDTLEIWEIMRQRFPQTFEVTTPSGGHHALFCLTDDQVFPVNKFHIPGDNDEDGNPKPCGEIRQRMYIVGAGSVVRIKNSVGEWIQKEYTISQDLPIAKISYTDFEAAVEPYLLTKKGEKTLTPKKLEGKINEGERHDTLFRLACRLIGFNEFGGASANEATILLNRFNNATKNPISDSISFIPHIVEQAVQKSSNSSGVPYERIYLVGFNGLTDFERQAALKYVEAHPDERRKKFLEGKALIDKIGATPEETKLAAEALEQALKELSENSDIEKFLLDQVHRTVSSHDDHIIKSVFHTGLSTYIKPLNLALKCESGSGKTYGTTETIKFFPPENVQFIGSQSPKVLSHENGVRKTADGKNFDDIPEPEKPEKEKDDDQTKFKGLLKNWKKEIKAYRKIAAESYYEVDLRNKVIVFMESVNIETFKMLKSTMSHDHDFIDHKYVDDKGKVHKTRLIGSPVLIFNSLDNEYVEEFSTRCLTTTPNTEKNKIEASMRISNTISSYPWKYQNDNFNKRLLQEYIRRIGGFLSKGKIKAVNPFESLFECFSKDAIRDMRDFNKFLELMPSYAVFKLFQRPIIEIEKNLYLIPTIQDALDAKETFDAIAQTTKTGTEFRIIEFYSKYVKDKVNGAEAEALTDEYNRDHKKRPISVKRVRFWLSRLEEIGWVDIRNGEHTNDKGYIDRRFNNYLPLKVCADTPFFETSVDLKPNLEKSVDKWVENVSAEIASTPPIIILNLDGSGTQITIDDLKTLIKGSETAYSIKNKVGGTPFHEPILNEAVNIISEKKPKSTLVGEISTSAHFPEDKTKPQYLYKTIPQGEPCGYCGVKRFNVTKKVLTPTKETQSRCEDCFKKLYDSFKECADFIEEVTP